MPIRLSTVPLNDHDADWLTVMANASETSLRQKVASVLSYYVRRRKDQYVQMVQYLADKHGLTFEECFHKLRRGEDLGEPLESWKVDPEMEKLKGGEIP